MIKIFVSYSHRDSNWVAEDGKYQLIPLLEEQFIGEAEIWTDYALPVQTGDDYTKLITSKINEADIIILLISLNFFKRGYIDKVELPLIKKRFDAQEVKIIPLLIGSTSASAKRHIGWIFDNLQTYPDVKYSLLDFVVDDTKWDKVKVDIVEIIENKIDLIKNELNNLHSDNMQNGKTPNDINKVVYQSESSAHNQEDQFLAVEYLLKSIVYHSKNDYLKALEWLVKAAEKGDSDAMYNIGMLYYEGLGVDQNYSLSKDWYLKASENGNVFAMNNIGNQYKEGLGVAKDYDNAIEWYRKAAKTGNSDAMENIGDMYSDGLGVEKDEEKANEYWDKAFVEHDDTIELFEGSTWYKNQDYVKAMDWYIKSAQNGNSIAMIQIGSLYKDGLGVKQDYRKAMKWYVKAALTSNDSDALFYIGHLYENGYGVIQDKNEAMIWYVMAAEKGNSDAMCVIGYFYFTGIVVNQDNVKAMEWFLKAANKGDSVAMYNLGYFYTNGLGVEKDDKQAKTWYTKACEYGEEEACDELKKLL